MKGGCDGALDRPRARVSAFLAFFFLSFLLIPFIGVSFFPRTDAGQFVINIKAPTGTRIEVTEDYVKQSGRDRRQVIRPERIEHGGLEYRALSPTFPRCSRPTPACTRHSSKWA